MLLVGVFTLSVALALTAGQEPSCVCLEDQTNIRGLVNPIVLKAHPDGTDRNFIAEQNGLVWLYNADGIRSPQPFINLTQIVQTGGRVGDERGFLALNFHPQYTQNGKVFIYYSIEIDDEEYTHLSEVTMLSGRDDVIDPSSERVLMRIPQPYANHNGGEITFLDDGTLLIFTGDGGSGGDPFDNGQDLSTLLGKVLRIDLESRSPGKEYGIPSDNPFLGDPRALPEVYAYGFRNPWRAFADPGDRITGEGRGRIFIGDVGQNGYEEVDLLERGGNFGWAAREGPQCYKQELCGNIGPEVFPIHYYDHRDGSKCIIGGPVYRGCASPAFNGWYFFGDYVTSQLWRLTESSDGNWEEKELSLCSSCSEPITGVFLLSWGVDARGEIYWLGTDNPQIDNQGGRIYRVYDPNNTAPRCPL